MSQSIQRPYSVKNCFNERKSKLLKETLVHLENGASGLHDLIVTLYGGVKPDMLDAMENLDINLFCALCWFRALPASDAKKPIAPSAIPEKYKEYYGVEATEEVVEYFSGKVNKEYVWNDCRQQYDDLCEEIGCLDEDIRTMLWEGYLPVVNTKSNKAWSTISNIFGDGEKEDRPKKCKILKKIIETLELEDKFFSLEKLKKVCCSAAECKTISEFAKTFSPNGRHSTLVKILKGTIELDPAGLIKDLHKKAKNKQFEIKLPHKKGIRNYINSIIRLPFHQKSYSEMWKAAVKDIEPKNTRNYNLIKEKLEIKKELQNHPGKDFENILLEYFNSEYFNQKDKFVIRPSHFGGKEIEYLFECTKNLSDEENAEEYCAHVKSTLNRDPIYTLIQYILSVRNKHNLTAQKVLDGCKYISSKNRYESQHVHPTVKGGMTFTWGDSALEGRIIPPDSAKFKNGFDSRIWLELEVLENNKWVKHHYPVYNTKFLEDLYVSGTDKLDAPRRTKEFAVIGTSIKDEYKEHLKCGKRFKKAAKRQARLFTARDNGTLGKVEFPECAITISSSQSITLCAKFNYVSKKDLSWPPKVGQRVLGFDQNQTAAHTYAIYEICEEGEGIIFFRDQWFKPIKTGKVQSVVKIKEKEFDQLSYNGLDYSQYEDWRKKAKAFLYEVPKELREIKGRKKNKNIIKEFNRIIMYKPSLYEFNYKYALLLKKVVKNLIQDNRAEFLRKEIIRFLTTEYSILRLGSLSQYTLDAMRACKSVISCYFSCSLPEHYTDKDAEGFDKTLFDIRKKIEKNRQNKKKEKVNRCASEIINIAITNNVSFVYGEADLSSNGSKNTKKAQNNRNMDWLTRSLGKKIQDKILLIPSIRFYAVSPHYTSHQDPFVHTTEKPIMRARFDCVDVDKINKNHMTSISKIIKCKNNKKSKTNQYYYEQVEALFSHYGIKDLETDLKNCKIEQWEFRKTLKEKDASGNVMIPKRGGRWYLATHPIVSGAKLYSFNGKDLWLSDADEIAAMNIALANFASRTHKSNS